MSTQVFNNNNYQEVQTWTPGGCILTYQAGGNGNASLANLIVTGITIQFQRSISPMYPINISNKTRKINLAGQPRGTLQITSMMGPCGDELEALIKATSDACTDSSKSVKFTLSPFVGSGCSCDSSKGGTKIKWELEDVILSSLSVTIQNQGEMPIINEPLTFEFSKLLIADSAVGKS